MRHPETVEDYLGLIAQAIDRAISYIRNLENAEALQQNGEKQDAIVRNLEIIGEAASRIQKIDGNFVAAHPEVPWIEMRGMRNKMIHNYFDVDWHIVWDTVKNDLPPLRRQITGLLEHARRSGSGGAP